MKRITAGFLAAAYFCVSLSGCMSGETPSSSGPEAFSDPSPTAETASSTPEHIEAQSPESTPESIPEPTPKISDPVAYQGSGDDVITIDPPEEGWVLHITGNAEGRHFSVKGYDAEDEQTELFVNTTDPYEGITLDPSQKTEVLEITATGDWTVELRSILAIDMIKVGETVSGTGDSVLRVISSGSTAKITGNEDGRYFGVKSYGTDKDDLMVNTTDPFDGRIKLKGDPVVLEVKAVGPWSITFE